MLFRSQDAARHAEAIEWIARQRSWGAYADASEDARQALLVRELAEGRTTIGDLQVESAGERVRDVIETFRVAAALHPESLGAYVITMASRPSDVLAVELLQRIAGQPHPQRVVPLFETADDLGHAGATLDALLSLPWYRERIRGHQEVMVGYSDSAKDAGRFASAWMLYRGQEDIIAACERHGVDLTLFHGRGGSIGRGGGPTYLAIQSQPPRRDLQVGREGLEGPDGKTDESFLPPDSPDLPDLPDRPASVRVTEQGETIEAKFGLVDIAVRTLEVYMSALLEATVAPPAPPPQKWRATVERLAGEARSAYRSVVYETPQFLEYFHTATPEAELAAVNIGSRPARRPDAVAKDDGVDRLRAIPWQFAWIQTRLLLPSWLGVDAALSIGDHERLRAMYDGWPFFRSTLDLIAIALAEADPRIAAQYDRLAPAALRPLGADLRQRFARATDAVLAVMGTGDLLHDNPVLRRSIELRNPYVDPINLVQIELLRRLRSGAAQDSRLRHAFVVTVNGVAAGMRNTG